MPYLRQLPRIPATGKIAVRLTPAQRDVLLGSSRTPRDVGHRLHRAPVRKGKLEVRVGREALDALILIAAAAIPTAPASRAEREQARALDTFVRYLEDLSDRFEMPEEPAGEEEG
jgi:hypothetical protein